MADIIRRKSTAPKEVVAEGGLDAGYLEDFNWKSEYDSFSEGYLEASPATQCCSPISFTHETVAQVEPDFSEVLPNRDDEAIVEEDEAILDDHLLILLQTCGHLVKPLS
ncbi:hypothetical protein [Halodesulfovibrio sp.]|uniref:hypothetical protein n=1 Tax=Halodesulfovibrio sp. TaxID=1912772 RepID=UPI0025C1FDFF|nr:hypothetical protein [Halodesulfovibrio sp.]